MVSGLAFIIVFRSESHQSSGGSRIRASRRDLAGMTISASTEPNGRGR